MTEQRASPRDKLAGPGVSSFTETPDGMVLEGVVKDISDDGAGIIGPTTGLHADDDVRVIFVIQSDQKVMYRGVVKRIDEAGEFFGIQFTWGPEPIVGVSREVKRCTYCRRTYTPEWNYCGTCGRELHTDEVPTPGFGD